MGGPGSERDVSLATGHGVAKALRSLGAEVTEVDVRGADFELPRGRGTRLHRDPRNLRRRRAGPGDSGEARRSLHGRRRGGERIAFDKILSKEKFDAAGVTTPDWEIITSGERPTMPLPFVIKAPRQGSTVGVYIVKDETELDAALADAAEYDERLLVEKFIPARELTVGVLGDQALPIIEIIAKDGFYDFADKYPFLNPGAARRRRAARLSGEIPAGADARDSGSRAAGASLARPASLLASRRDAAARPVNRPCSR